MLTGQQEAAIFQVRDLLQDLIRELAIVVEDLEKLRKDMKEMQAQITVAAQSSNNRQPQYTSTAGRKK